MLHCGSKLDWLLLGLSALLLVQLTDGRWHNLHSLRRARSEPVGLLLDEDDEQPQMPVRRPRNEEAEDEYQDSLDDDDDDDSYEEAQRARHHRPRGGRHRLQHHLPLTSQFGESEKPSRLAREQPGQRHRARGKRLSQRKHWTEKDKESFSHRPLLLDNERREYELEVREAQNSSLCNYTVVPIPDPGGRIPRELEHVKCNHVGSRCQDKGTYCCIQTYRNVEVLYEGGRIEMMKVYSGCVCSLQIYGTLEPYAPDLEIND